MGIDRALLERRLDELYAIGAQPDGGTYRPLYGPAWAAAGDLVERWLKDGGLKTRRDAVGNIWGRAGDGGKSIVTGSHIDTVRRGGRLDGALGIVAGLTAVEALLKQRGEPRRPLEVVAICEEEGSRFPTNLWGSRAIIGAIDTPDLVVYNPSYRVRGPFLQLDPAEVSKTLTITALGGFIVAQAALKRMVERGHGALFFTGASASVKGYAESAPFAMGKFALRGLAQSLAREFGPKNIHVAHFVIDGGIRRPDGDPRAAARGADGMLDPDAIAETYMSVYRQHRSAWSFEVDLRPWAEKF